MAAEVRPQGRDRIRLANRGSGSGEGTNAHHGPPVSGTNRTGSTARPLSFPSVPRL